ncbi:decapping mRNA 1 [Lycorma delicatula]|uniref:decapping mRNA 1 n=1 Tax=Lycorma delicatula TaxID=130591 RepID=UPI003F518231
MAQLSESRMNVAALTRVDPYVKDIVETAAHVALYTFNGDDNEWEKTEVEGALFVYSRSGQPFHNIIIMNRLNTNNFVEPVTQELDLHIQDPFLLYRTRGGIFCIWFYDKEECSRIATALQKLVKEIVQNSEKKNIIKKSSKDGNMSTVEGGNVDIFSMLTKAQEEYNNKSPRRNQNNEDIKNKDNCDTTPRSVMEFFAKASSGTQFNKDGPKRNLPTNILMGSRPLPPPGLTQMHPVPIGLPQHGDVKIIQRLMSNPAHSVEHIEKQQRSITPQSELAALMRSKAPNLAGPNKDLGKHKNKTSANTENKSNINSIQSTSVTSIQSQIENGMGFLRINDSSPTPATTVQTQKFFNTNLTKHSPIINSNMNNELPVEQRSLSAPHGTSALDATPSKPALMPPVMFTSSATKDETCNITSTSRLVPNASSASSTIPMTSANKIKPEPLTQNQLLQAFNYLLKNDPDFIRMLHEAYVKSFSEMVS